MTCHAEVAFAGQLDHPATQYSVGGHQPPHHYYLQGHLVGHIKDIGHDPTKATTRLYATHEAQPVHNDSADIVGASPLNIPDCAPSSASCHLRCTRRSLLASQ